MPARNPTEETVRDLVRRLIDAAPRGGFTWSERQTIHQMRRQYETGHDQTSCVCCCIPCGDLPKLIPDD